jgi:pimeloyl-ACP methyl ester carboxylesterase
MKFYLLLAALFSSPNLISLNLYDLDHETEFLDSGKKLMSLNFGIHDLEPNQETKAIIIAIHGRDSRGFEWIYPLQTIDSENTKTYFFRWDTTKCPQQTVPILMKEIQAIEGVEKITILGHSYGGVLSSLLLNEIQNIETNVHAIAAPLSSKDLEKYCNYVHPTSKNNNISYYQWRTVKKLDYAFNSLDYDPQVVDFEKSNVIRLPNEYRGKRLGHLWSISWVADSIKSKQSSDN